MTELHRVVIPRAVADRRELAVTRCGSGRPPLEFEWLGAREPGLWNWLRVTAPHSATAVEVALALWNSPRPAAGLTMAGAYVGVPPEWACRIAGASARRPEGFCPPASMAMQLASSRIADEVALAQVEFEQLAVGSLARPHTARRAPDRERLLETLGSTTVALEALYRELKPWALHMTLVAAINFVRDKRWRLRHARAAETAKWAPVVVGQRDIVRAAEVGTLRATELLAHVGLGVAASDVDRCESCAPHVLQMYAQAAGASQLVVTACGALTRATMARALLEAALRHRSEVAVQRRPHRRHAVERSNPAAGYAHQRSSELPKVEF